MNQICFFLMTLLNKLWIRYSASRWNVTLCLFYFLHKKLSQVSCRLLWRKKRSHYEVADTWIYANFSFDRHSSKQTSMVTGRLILMNGKRSRVKTLLCWRTWLFHTLSKYIYIFQFINMLALILSGWHSNYLHNSLSHTVMCCAHTLISYSGT